MPIKAKGVGNIFITTIMGIICDNLLLAFRRKRSTERKSFSRSLALAVVFSNLVLGIRPKVKNGKSSRICEQEPEKTVKKFWTKVTNDWRYWFFFSPVKRFSIVYACERRWWCSTDPFILLAPADLRCGPKKVNNKYLTQSIRKNEELPFYPSSSMWK